METLYQSLLNSETSLHGLITQALNRKDLDSIDKLLPKWDKLMHIIYDVAVELAAEKMLDPESDEPPETPIQDPDTPGIRLDPTGGGRY